MPITPPPLPSTPSMVSRRHRYSSDTAPPSTRRSRRYLLEPQNVSLQSILFHTVDDEDDNFSRYDFSCKDEQSFRRRPNLAAACGISQHVPDAQQVKMVSAYTLDDDTVYIDSVKLSKQKKAARKDEVKSEQPLAHERVPIQEISFCKDSFIARCGTPKRRKPKWDEAEFLEDIEAIMQEVEDSAVELEKVADVNLDLRSVPYFADVGVSSDESAYSSLNSSSFSKGMTKSTATQVSVETAVVQVMGSCQAEAKKEDKKESRVKYWMSSKMKKIRLPSFPRFAGTTLSTKSGKAPTTGMQAKSAWIPRNGRTNQLNTSVRTERTAAIDRSGEF